MKRIIEASLYVGLAFIFLSPVFADNSKKAPVKITVGYFSNVTHAQALIGRANRWFGENLAPDAVVDWKIFNAGPSAVEAIFAGQLDIAYLGPSPAVNAFIKSDGEAVRIVSGSSSGGAALVVRGDSGIKKPQDFHGKKIASPQLGNTQDVSLRSWISQQGLKLKEVGGDVQVLPLVNADHLTLFLKKEVDASWTIEPWVSALVRNGGGKIFLSESKLWKGGRYATTVVLVRTKFLNDHPDLVKRFIETHVKLTDWINAHPEEAKAVFKTEFERETGREFSQKLLDESWDRVEFTYDPLPLTVTAQAIAAYRAGFLKKDPDLRFLYDMKYIPGHNKLNRKEGPAIEGELIETIWNSEPYIQKIFGLTGNFDPNNPVHVTKLQILANIVGTGNYDGFILNDVLQAEARSLPRVSTVSILKSVLKNQYDIIVNIWENSSVIGTIFGSDFATYDGNNLRHVLLAAELGNMLPDGTGVTTFEGHVANPNLSGVTSVTINRFQNVLTLKNFLTNKSQLVEAFPNYGAYFGLASYAATNPVHRALIDSLERRIKIVNSRETGALDVINPDLGGVTTVHNAPLIFTSSAQLIDNLKLRADLVNNFSDYGVYYGIKAYVAANPVHRALIDSIALKKVPTNKKK